jgi:hypothetical protein
MSNTTTTTATTATTAVTLSGLFDIHMTALKSVTSAAKRTEKTAAAIAAEMDNVSTLWSSVKWGQVFKNEDAMTADKLAHVASDLGCSSMQVKEMATCLIEFRTYCKGKKIGSDQAVQDLARQSVGYTGSRPRHPDVVAKAKKAAEDKKASDGKKKPTAKKEPAGKEKPLQDMVQANPALVQIALTQIIAGITTCAKLRKANKIKTDDLKTLIASLEEALEVSLTVK